MESLQNKIDWATPQRQPVAGMLVVVIKTFWEGIKRLWPILLISIFRGERGKFDKYEIIALAIMGLILLAGVIRFIYFRFFIVNNELVIKKGWLKKEVLSIPLQKIQSVHIEQPYLHQLLGIVKLSLDTAGSSKTEATIDALNRPMAEALRMQLMDEKQNQLSDAQPVPVPIVTLTTNDLLKLSISANHLEAFFILLSFTYGIYVNIRQINLDVPATSFQFDRSLIVILFLITTVLIFTGLVSTARIFFKFYDFKIYNKAAGFYIRSGLTNVKEQIVPLQKIQFVNWKANWIRKKMKLWLLEYNISGADEMQRKMKVQVPVTQPQYIPVLVESYSALPGAELPEPVTIHRSYFIRLTLVATMAAAIFIAITWTWWQSNSFFILFYPALVFFSSWLYHKKFRLYGFSDKLYINKGVLGEEKILLKWYKVQSITFRQSFYQRQKKLASVVLHTASGSIIIPFIDINAARYIVNYGLYEIERLNRPWM